MLLLDPLLHKRARTSATAQVFDRAKPVAYPQLLLAQHEQAKIGATPRISFDIVEIGEGVDGMEVRDTLVESCDGSAHSGADRLGAVAVDEGAPRSDGEAQFEEEDERPLSRNAPAENRVGVDAVVDTLRSALTDVSFAADVLVDGIARQSNDECVADWKQVKIGSTPRISFDIVDVGEGVGGITEVRDTLVESCVGEVGSAHSGANRLGAGLADGGAPRSNDKRPLSRNAPAENPVKVDAGVDTLRYALTDVSVAANVGADGIARQSNEERPLSGNTSEENRMGLDPVVDALPRAPAAVPSVGERFDGTMGNRNRVGVDAAVDSAPSVADRAADVAADGGSPQST
ncbi:hypothetical protein BDK51DRAFT_48488, partial [Blyttiomyces helicus]